MQNNHRNTAGLAPACKSKTPTTGQTVAGAIDQNNDLDFPTNTRNDKAFSTLRAAYALRGHTLHRSHPGDGAMTYYATKWGMVKHLPDIDAAQRFLRQIGGEA